MTLRAQFEEVLERYGVCVCGKHNYVVLKKRSDVSHYEGLLNDLLACIPQLSDRPHTDHLCKSHLYNGCADCRSMVVDKKPQLSREAGIIKLTQGHFAIVDLEDVCPCRRVPKRSATL